MWVATITWRARTRRPFSIVTAQRSPSLTAMARVPSNTSAPSSRAAAATPTRYFTGWNSAWSGRHSAPGTPQGNSVSEVTSAGSPASRSAAASSSTSAICSVVAAHTYAGLRRRSQSMPSSLAVATMCSTPKRLAWA